MKTILILMVLVPYKGVTVEHIPYWGIEACMDAGNAAIAAGKRMTGVEVTATCTSYQKLEDAP